MLICLALDSTLILSWLSTCDHKGGMPDDAPYCCSSEQHTAHIAPHTIPSLPLTPMPASRSPRGLGTPQPRGSGTFGHPQGSGTLSPEPRGLICANPDPLPRLGRSPSLGPELWLGPEPVPRLGGLLCSDGGGEGSGGGGNGKGGGGDGDGGGGEGRDGGGEGSGGRGRRRGWWWW